MCSDVWMHVNRHALRVIRERSGLSVSALSRLSGISQPHLSNIELGKRHASPDAITRLAQALQVPLLALLADSPDAETEGSTSAS
jgi:transcriptional regulator with XRE-family HTH domain